MTITIMTYSPAMQLARPIRSYLYDFSFFIAPGFLSVIIALLAVGGYLGLDQEKNTPLWAWVLLVLLCDVAHVYASLFRTYFNHSEWQRSRRLLKILPIAVFGCLFALHVYSSHFFWRILAYIAVFHFIRQQVGFISLFGYRDLKKRKWERYLDKISVYNATFVPVIFWHCTQRNFAWFVEGDFITGLPPDTMNLIWPLYLAIIAIHILFRTWQVFRDRYYNILKDLLLVSTYLTWYVGIVALNFDFAFTVTNVLLHGIAYMGLVWHTENRSFSREKNGPGAGEPVIIYNLRQKAVKVVPLFLGVLFLLAYAEEWLWHGLVWKEHAAVFSEVLFPLEIKNQVLMAALVSLLTLPQATHYLVDGLIWRPSRNRALKSELFV